MKKLDREKAEILIGTAEKRFRRSIRKKHRPKKRHRASLVRHEAKTSLVEAPDKLDIYSQKNHSKFIEFIENLRRHSKLTGETLITFRNTTRITAAAGLLLIAEVDRITKAFPEKRFKCSLPPKFTEGKFRNSNDSVECSLNQIGFFKLIKQTNNRQSNLISISKWSQLSGDTADGSIANNLLDSIADKVPEASRRKIYRGAIEAIANCVEHAYPDIRDDGLNIIDKRWWMLVGADQQNLTVIVCDLGVGIARTLPQKHPASLLDQIKSTFGIFGQSDSEMIRISTHIKQTRTGKPNRGKGGKDFRSITRNFPSATLIIRSNKGTFAITGKDSSQLRKVSARKFVEGTDRTESTIEHSKSIRGTILEWIVPLKDVKE